MKIVCIVLLHAKHLTDIARDRVVIVYVDERDAHYVRAVLRQNMMKSRNNMRWRFYCGGLITHFLKVHEIEKEEVNMTVTRHLDLTGKLVDVTRRKALDTSHRPVFSTPDKQVCDESVMASMFGMAELQFRIEGRHVKNDKI